MYSVRLRKRKGWAKNRLPILAVTDVVNVDVTELGGKESTPYRLPRIETNSPNHHYEDPFYSARMWGPFGFENVVRVPKLNPEIRQHNITTSITSPDHPSKPLGAQYRQSGRNKPTFRNAAITPRKTAIPLNKDPSDMEDFHNYLNSKNGIEEECVPPGPTPTPIGRTLSPTKSVKSIHWALGSSEHPLFDKKGRSRIQGPYSREFTVKCATPTKWLKMKLGKTRA